MMLVVDVGGTLARNRNGAPTMQDRLRSLSPDPDSVDGERLVLDTALKTTTAR